MSRGCPLSNFFLMSFSIVIYIDLYIDSSSFKCIACNNLELGKYSSHFKGGEIKIQKFIFSSLHSYLLTAGSPT